MASAGEDLDETVDFHTLVTLMHDCDLKEALLQNTRKEIDSLQSEVEKLRLEKKWCFDEKGNRVVPALSDQAHKICQQIMLDPDMLKDVVKALRIKKLNLQSNINHLKDKRDDLSAKTE